LLQQTGHANFVFPYIAGGTGLAVRPLGGSDGRKALFSGDNIPTKPDDCHGLAKYVRTQPDVASQDVKPIDLEMNFEEAMKLFLAIQSCLIQLNRYNRSTTAGREMDLRRAPSPSSRNASATRSSGSVGHGG
jgi:hypothetical protein